MKKVLCSGGGERRVGRSMNGRGKEERSFFRCEIVCGREEMRVFVCSDHHKLTVFLVVGCVCCSDVC